MKPSKMATDHSRTTRNGSTDHKTDHAPKTAPVLDGPRHGPLRTTIPGKRTNHPPYEVGGWGPSPAEALP